jgi:hypothetical protein
MIDNVIIRADLHPFFKEEHPPKKAWAGSGFSEQVGKER